MADGSTSFRPSTDNRVYLASVENKNEFLNSLLDKVRTGQLADISDKADSACIYNMPTTDSNASHQCPVIARWPELGEKGRLGDLLTCCRQCPRRQEYLALVKRRLKYPTAFEQQAESTYTPPEEKPAAPDITIKCDDCGASVSLSDFATYGTPLLAMRNGMLQHVQKRHERQHLSAQEWPAHLARRLTSRT